MMTVMRIDSRVKDRVAKDQIMAMFMIAFTNMTSEDITQCVYYTTLMMKVVPKAILTEESGNMATDLEGEPNVVP